MKPSDQSILKTVQLLVMLHRASKNDHLKKTNEEKDDLFVKKEYVTDAGMTVPEFMEAARKLEDKGYVMPIGFFDSKFKNDFINFKDHPEFSALEKHLNENKEQVQESMEKAKEIMAEYIKSKTPADHVFPEEEFMAENFDMVEMMNQSSEDFSKMPEDTVARIIMIHFRDMDRLLRLLESGQTLDQVKDPGLWYDHEKYIFHIDEEQIPTSYQGKPNREHFVLQALFKQLPKELVIDYVNTESFDTSRESKKENKSFRDAMDRFTEKHSGLPDIFDVHETHTKFNSNRIEHTH